MSLLSPPAFLPVHLIPAWPWIWLQHMVLLAWIRLTYGRGYLYCWGISQTGRVELLWIDLESRDRALQASVVAPASRRLTAALSGEALELTCTQFIQARARKPSTRMPRFPALKASALPLPDS